MRQIDEREAAERQGLNENGAGEFVRGTEELRSAEQSAARRAAESDREMFEDIREMLHTLFGGVEEHSREHSTPTVQSNQSSKH